MAKLTQDEKDKELYKASLQAFFQNETENDKIILSLCMAGIGFYIAIFQTNGKITEIMFITSLLSLVMFAFTALIILRIFVLNKKQLLSIVKNNGAGDEDQELWFHDKYKYIPFMVAIVSSVVFACAIIFKSIN